MAKLEKAQPAAKTKPARCIYCGPNLPSGVLQRHTVFKGGLPAHLDALIAECPAIAELCIPIAELAATDKAISAKGTQAHTLYEDIQKYARKGGK